MPHQISLIKRRKENEHVINSKISSFIGFKITKLAKNKQNVTHPETAKFLVFLKVILEKR
jgi:hypothetical protein